MFWSNKMKKRYDITGLGYSATDYIGFVPRIPVENTKLELSSLTVQGGGPAATATVTAARLGLTAAFIGKRGDDDFGERSARELAGENIDISGIVIEKDGCSHFAFIMVNEETAERTILWSRGSISMLEAGEVDTSIIGQSRGLLIDSLEPAAALHAARFARENGIEVLIDAGTLREGVEEILPYCDHIITSETFSRQFSRGEGHAQTLRKLSSYGPHSAVVTVGEGGCLALVDGEVIEIRGFDVKAVDTTGAGDVFHGSYLFAVLQGLDTAGCCVFSNAVAAMKCRAAGGRAGIPSLDEVLSFLAANGHGGLFDPGSTGS